MTLYSTGSEAYVHDVAVDPDAGKVYWIEFYSPNVVMRANLDGTDVEVVVPAIEWSDLAWGLALDALHGKIYWTYNEPSDDGPAPSGLFWADLDGSDVELIHPNNVWGMDVAVDPEAERLYWGNGSAVFQSALDGSNPTVLAVMPAEVYSLDLWPGPGSAVAQPDMSRFLGAPTASVGGGMKAARVRLVQLYNTDPDDPDNAYCRPRLPALPDLSAFDGEYRWAGPPAEHNQREGVMMALEATVKNLVAAPLQCCPHYRDFSRGAFVTEFGDGAGIAGDIYADYVYLFGAEVVPCSTYELQYIDQGCAIEDEGCYSAPIVLRTGLWGDTYPPFQASGSFQPSSRDIGEIIDLFKGFPPGCGNPKKFAGMLRGNIPPLDQPINFADVGRCVDGHRLLGYAEVGPSACPPCE